MTGRARRPQPDLRFIGPRTVTISVAVARRSALTREPRWEASHLHTSLTDKAAALCCLLVNNHPFVDGNKRFAHAATETFLILNGSEIDGPADEQEGLMLDLASGRLTREQLAAWLLAHLRHAG